MTASTPGQDETTNARERGAGRSRVQIAILVVLAILGLLIALGGATAMIWLRRSAPNDAFEVIVAPDVPLRPGDTVTYVVGNQRCSGVSVLGVRADGRVSITPCDAGARAMDVSRATLRLPRFPERGSLVEPRVGDVVLVHEDGRFTRATITGVEPARLRVVPLRVGGAPPSRDGGARFVPRAVVYLVRRPDPSTPPAVPAP